MILLQLVALAIPFQRLPAILSKAFTDINILVLKFMEWHWLALEGPNMLKTLSKNNKVGRDYSFQY